MNHSKACDQCARSKTKCTWSGGAMCERCSRLKLGCVSTPSGPRKKREKSTRIQTLEKEVAGLKTMLAAPGQPSPSGSADTPTQLQQQSTPYIPAWMPGIAQSQSPTICIEPEGQPYVGPTENIDIAAGFRVSVAEADRILQEYTSSMLPNFPFVPITFHSAQEMYREQPLLLKVIVSSCRPQVMPMQSSIGQWFREYFAYHIVVLNECRLELLQAILVFVAWQDSMFFVEALDTSILQLALGLVGVLGLSRTPEAQRMPPGSIIDDATTAVRGLNLHTTRSLADRRALLGVFYTTAAARIGFRRAPPMEYTDYMQQCCEALAKAQEYPTDVLLVTAVHMQQLVLQINIIFPGKTPGEKRTPIAAADAHAIATTSRRLDEVTSEMIDTSKTSYLLRSHQHAARVRLYEPVIYMLHSADSTRGLTRGQGLWECLQGIRSVLEQLLQVPAETLSMLPFPFFAHLSFANVTLSRLLMVRDPNWDAPLAFQGAEILHTLELLGDHLELGDQLSGPRRRYMKGDMSYLMRLAHKMRWFKNWYEARLPSEPSNADSMFAIPGSFDVPAEEAQFWQEFAIGQSLAF